ncbi:hypothetical protein FACS1894122_13000 [Alphaproteobacteria bacterium]|nr:hypothetical protein FACS1894122_13000 [Alphaproteobacteria bacterium]
MWSPYGRIYKDKGNGNVLKGWKFDKSSNSNRFLGVLALGGGRVFGESFYAGAEALIDFSSSKNKEIESNEGKFGRVKHSAVSQSLALRLGYFNRNIETLFYTKAVASYVSTKFTTDSLYDKLKDKTFKVSQFAPAVALGVEKAFGKKISARLECEYRFDSKKKFEQDSEKLDLKTDSGVNVRALVAYNINFL